MVLKVIVVGGDEQSKVDVDRKSDEIRCRINASMEPPNLYSFLLENLRGHEDVSIDLSEFMGLGLEKVDDRTMELFVRFIYSYLNNVPYSLKAERTPLNWRITGPEDPSVTNLVRSFELSRRMQETPPNILTTEEFSREIREFLGDCPHVTVEEISGERLASEGLNLIAAVGRASEHPPRLMVIQYRPNPDSKEVRALVGKGICFDTGGLNIKGGSYMCNMKFDMSGAAVSVATVAALSRNGSTANVVVLAPLAENSVSSNSYRPDDVIVSHSGKSIEIDNTDAEGRLILADALSYAVQKNSPTSIYSIATLTGAIGYALGSKYAGAFSSSEELWEEFRSRSHGAGEWVWRMPMDEFYMKDLRSSRVADLKNSTKTGAGGASRAATFLKEFVGSTPFLHMDIANVAHEDKGGISTAPLLRTLYGLFYSC